jgi:hypothetical protein
MSAATVIVVVCPECGGDYSTNGPNGIFVHVPAEHPDSIVAKAVELALEDAGSR